ncbi:unnamed protein product [Discosporangium mesarthrocarpum]
MTFKGQGDDGARFYSEDDPSLTIFEDEVFEENDATVRTLK